MTTDMGSAHGAAARRARLVTQVKGSVLRGRLTALADLKLIERVAPHLSEATRSILRSPPPASTWIDGAVLAELDDVVFDLLGERVLENVALTSVRQTISPLLRNVVEGSLRLFGTSPVTLLSRMETLSGSTVRGVSFGWTPEDEHHAKMLVTYPGSTDVPLSAFVAIRAGLVNVFEIAGAVGTVLLSARSDRPPRNTARFDCSW